MDEIKQIQLYKKIKNIMKAITWLKKDERVKYKETDYRAISEEKVTIEVRKQLIKEGLIIIPTEVKTAYDSEKRLTTIETAYKIIDVETGDCEIIKSCGQGWDSQDKGTGKAMTYAFKYLLLRTFAIPTGEDPDKVSNAEIDEIENKEKAIKLKGQITKVKNEILLISENNAISPDLGKKITQSVYDAEQKYSGETLLMKLNDNLKLANIRLTEAKAKLQDVDTKFNDIVSKEAKDLQKDLDVF